MLVFIGNTSFATKTLRMDDFLTPVKITATSDIQCVDDQLVAISSKQKSHTCGEHRLNSPEDALAALKSKPDVDLLTKVLQWLNPARIRDDHFNVKVPGPKASRILLVLVEEIIPNYWRVLKDGRFSNKDMQIKLIVRCLSSIAGIGVIITRLRGLLDSKDEAPNQSKNEEMGNNPLIEDMLDVLQSIIHRDSFLSKTWQDLSSLVMNSSQRSLMWKELISCVAGGRVLSIVGEADHKLNENDSSIKDRSWLGDGSQYSAWLGRNIAYMVTVLDQDHVEAQKSIARLLEKALKLGYTGEQSHVNTINDI